MEQTIVVQELNRRYNPRNILKGMHFTEGDWDSFKFQGINDNQPRTIHYRQIGFPFKEHERNAKEGWLVPLTTEEGIGRVVMVLNCDLEFIEQLLNNK